MIIVYIAGPYSAPDSWERERNIRCAEEMATLVMSLRGPQLGALCVHTMSRYWYGKVGEAHAIDWGLELLRRSDIVVACEGWRSSSGTINEIREAHASGKNVLEGEYALHWWHRHGATVEDLHEWMPDLLITPGMIL